MEVQLPVATKAKLMRQMLVQKERGSIQVLRPGRMVDSHHKDHLTFLTWKSSTILSKAKTKSRSRVHAMAM